MKKLLMMMPLLVFLCSCVGLSEAEKARIEQEVYEQRENFVNGPDFVIEENISADRLEYGELSVNETNDINQDSKNLFAKGYVILGHISFKDYNWGKKYVRELCEHKKMASVCLYTQKFVSADTSVIYGNVLTTNWYKGTIYFFAKLTAAEWQKRTNIGFLPADLTDQQRQQYKRNTGVIADIVYKGSKAYYANLLKGDLIIRVNGKPAYDTASLKEYMSSYEGDSYVITVLRDGKRVNIKY